MGWEGSHLWRLWGGMMNERVGGYGAVFSSGMSYVNIGMIPTK